MMNDDIFGMDQSPEDKFYEILCTMNKDVVRKEMNDLFKRLAILEEMQDMDDDMLDKKIRTFEHTHADKTAQLIQNQYLHITANMIGQHE